MDPAARCRIAAANPAIRSAECPCRPGEFVRAECRKSAATGKSEWSSPRPCGPRWQWSARAPLGRRRRARPINQGNGGEAEKFDRRIEESVGENGIAPSKHIVPIALLKFVHGFAFAVEELHDAHTGNVFLKKSVDAGNGRADAAIRVADE